MGSAVLFDDLVDFFNFSSCFIFSLILIVFTLQLFFLFSCTFRGHLLVELNLPCLEGLDGDRSTPSLGFLRLETYAIGHVRGAE